MSDCGPLDAGQRPRASDSLSFPLSARSEDGEKTRAQSGRAPACRVYDG